MNCNNKTETYNLSEYLEFLMGLVPNPPKVMPSREEQVKILKKLEESGF